MLHGSSRRRGFSPRSRAKQSPDRIRDPGSIMEWPRQGEGSRDMIRLGISDHLHDIEAECDLGHIQHPQPRQRRPLDQPPFLGVHRRSRTPKLLAAPAFDLDKNEHFPVAANNIRLTPTLGPEISPQNFIAFSAQMRDGPIFSLAPELQMGSPRRIRGETACFEPPEQRSGDGSGRVHVS